MSQVRVDRYHRRCILYRRSTLNTNKIAINPFGTQIYLPTGSSDLTNGLFTAAVLTFTAVVVRR